jgi:hypothetical protein
MTSPLAIYAPEGTNTTHCRPIYIHDLTTHWEISPQYLAYCLDQADDYDKVARVFVDATISGETKKKPKKKAGKKYKPIVNRVHSVATTLPEEFRIIRRFPSDPLEDMPQLNPRPPTLIDGE